MSPAAGNISLIEQYAPICRTERGRNASLKLAVSKGTTLLAYPSFNNILLRDVNDVLMRSIVFDGHGYTTTCAAVSPNGLYCCSGDVTGKIIVWALYSSSDDSASTGRGASYTFSYTDKVIVYEGELLSGAVREIEWSSDNQRILVAGEGRGGEMCKCIMWDSGNSVGNFAGISKSVVTADFRQNRPFRIVTGDEDCKVSFFEGPPFKFKASSDIHSNFVNCVRFSPEGNFIVTSSSDKKIAVFDGKNFDQLAVVTNAHEGSIFGVCFVSNDTFATVSADKNVKIWRISEQPEKTEVTLISTKSTSETGINAMQLGCASICSADREPGQPFVTVSLSGFINMFEVDNESAGPSRVVKGHAKAIKALAWCGQHKILFTGDVAGRVCLWRMGLGNAGVMEGPQHPEGGIHISMWERESAGTSVLVSTGLDNVIRLTSVTDIRSRSEDQKVLQFSDDDGNISKIPMNPQAISPCPQTGVLLCVTTSEILCIKDCQVWLCACSVFALIDI